MGNKEKASDFSNVTGQVRHSGTNSILLFEPLTSRSAYKTALPQRQSFPHLSFRYVRVHLFASLQLKLVAFNGRSYLERHKNKILSVT